jgi:hypothetical protein
LIIGLSGYARAGKDTTADILVKEYGFAKVAFADKLREALYALNPVIRYDKNDFGSYKYWRLQEVINECGWDGYKETRFNDEIRGLLQRMGTEVGRETIGQNTWVNAVLNEYKKDGIKRDYVIPDCRFWNEATAIVDEGGEIWRVHRPGVGPANSHNSETELDDYNFHVYLHNDSTVDYLAVQVQAAMHGI